MTDVDRMLAAHAGWLAAMAFMCMRHADSWNDPEWQDAPSAKRYQAKLYVEAGREVERYKRTCQEIGL